MDGKKHQCQKVVKTMKAYAGDVQVGQLAFNAAPVSRLPFGAPILCIRQTTEHGSFLSGSRIIHLPNNWMIQDERIDD